jgi:hypothetical protein
VELPVRWLPIKYQMKCDSGLKQDPRGQPAFLNKGPSACCFWLQEILWEGWGVFDTRKLVTGADTSPRFQAIKVPACIYCCFCCSLCS